ncbi:hypothetical protein A2U01_0030017 [Trifolium medium]|uniref:Uncharacterized protein n=1 Tax=Trifolium medium TaxID=97028 RepID=A0A392PDJ6_9FABA|nr:hypothetical protein [Trifolium medium]
MSNSAVLEVNSADSQSHHRHLVKCSASTSTAAASVDPAVNRPKRIIKRPLLFTFKKNNKIKKKKKN